MSEIAVSNLSKAFGPHKAVDDVSFTVASGEFVVLLGPSGCGKSTTLRLIAGLEQPSTGAISIHGRDVTQAGPSQRQISMVFQSYAVFPHLDVARNIVFGLEVRGVGKQERLARLARVADIVGLTPYLARRPAELSGGQRQRVALARAIISERPVCLMDEPLSNLDAKLRHEMRVEIRELQQRLGMTMLYVTHDQIEAMTMADRVILMKDGRIEQDGTPADLYVRPRTTFTARFVGLPPMNFIPAPDETGTVGIRAEDLSITASGGRLSGTVAAIEYLGADTRVSVDWQGLTLVARVPGASRLKRGDPAGLSWDDAAEHHFDIRGERRHAVRRFEHA
ncbi:MAG: ABC transporter ATP-binding protein [Ancalomicrobiaceae bacterium]|nr:ABC transporter ATP-binding protein [Ancalomicrobiaceae bacterium]